MNGSKKSLIDFISKAEGDTIKVCLYDKKDKEYKEANLTIFGDCFMADVERNFNIGETDLYLIVYDDSKVVEDDYID